MNGFTRELTRELNLDARLAEPNTIQDKLSSWTRSTEFLPAVYPDPAQIRSRVEREAARNLSKEPRILLSVYLTRNDYTVGKLIV